MMAYITAAGDRNSRYFTGTSDLEWSERGSAHFLSEVASKRTIVLSTVNFERSLGSKF